MTLLVARSEVQSLASCTFQTIAWTTSFDRKLVPHRRRIVAQEGIDRSTDFQQVERGTVSAEEFEVPRKEVLAGLDEMRVLSRRCRAIDSLSLAAEGPYGGYEIGVIRKQDGLIPAIHSLE